MLSLTKCGVLKIKHCGILINMPYKTHHDKSIGFFCQCNGCSVFHIMVKASVLQYGENTQTFYASEFCIGRELSCVQVGGFLAPTRLSLCLWPVTSQKWPNATEIGETPGEVNYRNSHRMKRWIITPATVPVQYYIDLYSYQPFLLYKLTIEIKNRQICYTDPLQ